MRTKDYEFWYFDISIIFMTLSLFDRSIFDQLMNKTDIMYFFLINAFLK